MLCSALSTVVVLTITTTAPAAPPVCTASSATYANPNGADIVFAFNCGAEACAAGAFANGDCWVVAPGGGLTVTSVEPPVSTGCGPTNDQTCHGWEVNPFGGTQGFDGRLVSFSAGLIPVPNVPTSPIPYFAAAGESLVKVVSDDVAGAYPCYETGGKSCVQFAAVLTVLQAALASPAQTFRPPPYGTDKPIFLTTELRTDMLSSLPATASMISGLTAIGYVEYFPLEY